MKPNLNLLNPALVVLLQILTMVVKIREFAQSLRDGNAKTPTPQVDEKDLTHRYVLSLFNVSDAAAVQRNGSLDDKLTRRVIDALFSKIEGTSGAERAAVWEKLAEQVLTFQLRRVQDLFPEQRKPDQRKNAMNDVLACLRGLNLDLTRLWNTHRQMVDTTPTTKEDDAQFGLEQMVTAYFQNYDALRLWYVTVLNSWAQQAVEEFADLKLPSYMLQQIGAELPNVDFLFSAFEQRHQIMQDVVELQKLAEREKALIGALRSIDFPGNLEEKVQIGKTPKTTAEKIVQGLEQKAATHRRWLNAGKMHDDAVRMRRDLYGDSNVQVNKKRMTEADFVQFVGFFLTLKEVSEKLIDEATRRTLETDEPTVATDEGGAEANDKKDGSQAAG